MNVMLSLEHLPKIHKMLSEIHKLRTFEFKI